MPDLATADPFATERRMMVDCQLRTFDVTDREVLAAFDTVPREAFVAPGSLSFAYADRDLPARDHDGRAMIAPMVLARMIQALRLTPDARALDVAGGAGYGAALMAELGARVTALESDWPAEAPRALADYSAARIACVAGAIASGYASGAPYDAILLHGMVGREPVALISQLRDGGRLVCGELNGEMGRIVCYERLAASFRKRVLFDAQLPELAEFASEPAFVF